MAVSSKTRALAMVIKFAHFRKLRRAPCAPDLDINCGPTRRIALNQNPIKIIPMILMISMTGSVENSVITPSCRRRMENGIAKMMVDARIALLTLAFPIPRERMYKT